MDVLTPYIKDMSVLRRFVFAANYLPSEYPMYLKTVCDFAVHKSTHTPIETHIAKVMLENIRMLDAAVFTPDSDLIEQLVKFPSATGEPTGIVLITPQKICTECSGIE